MSSKMSSSSVTRRKALMQQFQYLGQMQSTETALFHQLASAKNGMNITDSKTVTVLMLEGAKTAGQLAERLSLTTGAVTSVIDRLEAAGIARRVSDPSDRRKVIVEVDHKRISRMSNVYESMGRSSAKLLENYTNEQLEFILEFMNATLEMTKQEIAKLNQK